VDFRRLRYFAAAAETLSFTAAARRLRVSQPPVTRQIALLEEEVGLQLLRRTKRHVELTDAGRVFYDRVCRLFAAADAAVASARHAAQGETGTLRLGYGGASVYLLPAVLRSFRKSFPRVELALSPLNLGYQLTAIRDGQIDIGLVVQPVDDAVIETQPFATERLMAALPASHPLRGRAALSLSDLRQERFVMVPWRKGHGFGRLIMRVCGRAGFVPTIEQETEPMDSVLGLVSAGVGIALVPALYTRLPVPRVVYKPLRERFAVADIALAWRTDDTSPVRRAFVDIARRAAPMRSPGKGASRALRADRA
jgi:LysR family transcriptional regulator, benzoate and cis,cis-muconate-responsive activator of ben and cat genes